MIQGTTDEVAMLAAAKRRRGCAIESHNSEQVITESTLNSLVGAADVYDLKVCYLSILTN